MCFGAGKRAKVFVAEGSSNSGFAEGAMATSAIGQAKTRALDWLLDRLVAQNEADLQQVVRGRRGLQKQCRCSLAAAGRGTE